MYLFANKIDFFSFFLNFIFLTQDVWYIFPEFDTRIFISRFPAFKEANGLSDFSHCINWWVKTYIYSQAKAFVTLENENKTIINKEAGKMLRIQASELNLNTEKQSFFCPALIVRRSYLFGITAFTKKCTTRNLIWWR